MCRENTRLELSGGWEEETPSQVPYFLESLGSNADTSAALVSSQYAFKDAITAPVSLGRDWVIWKYGDPIDRAAWSQAWLPCTRTAAES